MIDLPEEESKIKRNVMKNNKLPYRYREREGLAQRLFTLERPMIWRDEGRRGIFRTAWSLFWPFVLPVYIWTDLGIIKFAIACFVLSLVMKFTHVKLVEHYLLCLFTLRSPVFSTKAPSDPDLRTRIAIAWGKFKGYHNPTMFSCPSYFSKEYNFDIGHKPATGKTKPVPPVAIPRQKQSTQLGNTSGLEPKFIDRLIFPTDLPTVHGIPGHGLQSSGFAQSQKGAGIKGELNLAKMLAFYDGDKLDASMPDSTILSNCHAFFSLHRPELNDSSKLAEADIDCVLYFGDTLVLIDAKMFRSGDLTYNMVNNPDGSTAIRCIDNVTGNPIGDDIHMSQNMKVAAETMADRFPQIRDITSYVVVMPTNRGEAIISPHLYYPGNIRVVTPQELYESVMMLNPSTKSADLSVINQLETMLKR